MEKSIAEKIILLNFDEKYKVTIDTFMASIAAIDYSEAERSIAYLKSKGIIIKRPSQVNVLLNSYEHIIDMVNLYEQNGDLKALQDDPIRINCKSAIERINYLRQNNMPYLDEKGKYLKCLFNGIEFNRLYGVAPQAVIAPVVEQPVTEPITEVAQPPIAEPVFEQQPIIEPVVEPALNVSAFTETTDEQIFVPSEPAAPVVEQPEVAPQPEVSAPIDMSAFGEPTITTDAQVEEEYASTQVFDDPIESILSKPQTIPLNDETFERYDSLSEITGRIIYDLYHEEELSDNIADNLIKLITNEVPDDRNVIFRSITHGRIISDEEKNHILNTINEKLNVYEDKEYTGIMSYNLGR